MAPVERCAQGPMPLIRGATPSDQQREAIAQPSGYRLDPEFGGPSRGKLDGERYAVEMPTDRGKRRA